MKALGYMLPFCPDVHLFHDRDKCVRWCEKKLGFTPMFVDGADAQTAYYDGTAVVLFEVADDPVWEYALLTHEAYHVVCSHLSDIGEERPGEETVAYMVQCVSGALMNAHMRWRTKHAGDMDGQQPKVS